MIKISILLPLCNNEKNIEICLKSILSQTMQNFEVIVIDGGCIDNSIEIIQDFQAEDSRIKILLNKNSNKINNIDYALNFARGEFISIINPNDILRPNMLEILYNHAIKDNCCIVKSNISLLKKDKIYPHNLFKEINTTLLQNVLTEPKILKITPSVSSALYRKNFLKENKINFNSTNNKYFQETSFQFKCFYLAKKIKFLKAPLYLHRIKENKSRKNISDSVFEIIGEFDSINQLLETNYINTEIENQKLLFELNTYIWNFKKIKKEYEKGFIDKISEIFNSYDTYNFFNDETIDFIDKYKLKLLLKNPNIFYYIYHYLKIYTSNKKEGTIYYE